SREPLARTRESSRRVVHSEIAASDSAEAGPAGLGTVRDERARVATLPEDGWAQLPRDARKRASRTRTCDLLVRKFTPACYLVDSSGFWLGPRRPVSWCSGANCSRTSFALSSRPDDVWPIVCDRLEHRRSPGHVASCRGTWRDRRVCAPRR